MVNQPQRVEDMSEHNLQTQTLQAALPHPSVDPPEIKPHTDHICSGLSSETSDISRVGVETCSTVIQSEQWDLMGPDASDAEGQKYNSQINVCLLLHFCEPEIPYYAHDDLCCKCS